MKLNEYQTLATKTASYPTKSYPFCCIAEESGEVMGKITKYMRKHGESCESTIDVACSPVFHREHELREALAKELGDVLWEVSQCARELGFNLEDIARMNIAKLQDRKERDVIDGEGDER